MRRLFIDSNIYLGFFNSAQPAFKKLLAALVELNDKIFVTHQIVDEVSRNKLNVFRISVDNYIKQSHFITTFLPEHLDSDDNKRIAEWNAKRKELEENALKLNKDLTEIIKDTLSNISNSEDKVSAELKKVFAKPLRISDGTVKKAKIRKEIGNPPGKLNDPLGDQLNWVQILENCKDISTFWIVSNDQDYFNEFNKTLFLNPLLQNELKAINPGIETRVFRKLSDALMDFNNEEKINSLPSNQELEKISQAEPMTVYQIPHHGSNQKFYGGGHAIPRWCPNCNKEEWYLTGEFRPSQLGGVTFQYECKYCHHFFDTSDHGDKDRFNQFNQYHS